MKLSYFLPILLILHSCQDNTEKTERKEKITENKSNKQTSIHKQPFSIGETITFHSKILDEDRTLNVYLPHGYHPDSLQKYSVIYLLDGSIDEDIIHISGIVQNGTFPWINKIPPSIVVGIANVDRKRDFTFPTTIEKDKKDFPTTGGSSPFINFLEQEVQPIIKKEYKINEHRTLIGQSLGGLLAAEILMKQPDLFDEYIIISPSLWWDNESLLKIAPVPFVQKKKIYIAVGKEGDKMERPAYLLYERYKNANFVESIIRFQYFEDLEHSNILHQAVYAALMES